MARMIPPQYTARTPRGERELFDRLRDDPDTKGWTVLHSFDLKNHQTKIEGEIDMLILVPDMGVLCVEVKGCEVRREQGRWIYPYDTSLEGPFKQASKAMHSLRQYIGRKDHSLSGTLFFSAVIFTAADFSETSAEWHPWQFLNRRLFLRQPISRSVTEIFGRAHALFEQKLGGYAWYSEKRSRPTREQIDRLTALLRSDFEYAVSPRNDYEEIEKRIRHFTEEQFDALDLLSENRRVVFKGPAGTGKTFLAVESARRAATEGNSVLLVCYNRLLGNWLAVEAKALGAPQDVIRTGTLHGLLVAIVGGSNAADDDGDYWSSTLPLQAADRLLDDQRTWPHYDTLIVDEAQDLLADEYLDVFDLLLKGGLAGGRWAFFGDFERQAIYLEQGAEQAHHALQTLAGRAPHHASFPLRINCRNAQCIAETLALASGLEPGYRRVLHDLEGADVDPLFYTDPASQKKQLQRALLELGGCFRPDEIIVLSTRSDRESCAAQGLSDPDGNRLVPIREIRDARVIAYTSIHAFKGMEAPAVIITDVATLDDERTRALLYVGMSRARVRLFMLMHESCRSTYGRMLDAGLAKTARR